MLHPRNANKNNVVVCALRVRIPVRNTSTTRLFLNFVYGYSIHTSAVTVTNQILEHFSGSPKACKNGAREITDLDIRRGQAVCEGALHGPTSSPEPFLCPLERGWLLYHPLTDRLLILNATAKIVWDLRSEGCELHDIAATFVRRFGISDEQALRDVARVLDDLTDDDTQAVKDGSAAPIFAADSRATTACIVSEKKSAVCGVFRFGQSTIKVRSSVTELDASFFSRFQHRAIADSGAEPLGISEGDFSYRLTFGDRVVAEAKTINRAICQLLELLLSLEHPDQRFLAYCHAGAVSHRGRSLLMPGNSGVGKSTLTGYLAAHGFAYLGDDVIAIGEDDMSLSLLPLPTCLSIKAGSWEILEPLFPDLSKLATLNRYDRSFRYLTPGENYKSLQAAAAPSAIVFPAYSSGKSTQLTPVRPTETMIHLLEANVRLSGWGPATEQQLAKFVRFVEQTPAYKLS